MSAFHFMQNAFFILVGVACVALAAVIVSAVIIGIYRYIKKGAGAGGK